jgi:hypothetical protein
MASFSNAGHVEGDNSLTVKCLFALVDTPSTLMGEVARKLTCPVNLKGEE